MRVLWRRQFATESKTSHPPRRISGHLQSRALRCNSQEECAYGKLVIATGCRPLRASKFGVKGDDLPNVFYVREECRRQSWWVRR